MSLLPAHIEGLILDMDGVIWKADTQIGNLAAIFEQIAQRGLKVVFATNNSTRTPQQYVERLATFGVFCEPWQVVTSSLVVADMLKKRFGEQAPIFAIGEGGLMEALTDANLKILAVEQAESAQAVVMGIDRQINFQKLAEATLLVRRGIPFYATNPDKTFPTPRGEIPGAGSWYSIVVTASEVEPIIAGKPGPAMMELALERLGLLKETVCVVGDRIETDILSGQAVGCLCALVLSGVSSRETGLAWRPAIDLIAPDLASLMGL
jgi:4-nitrophenyl phosphatase